MSDKLYIPIYVKPENPMYDRTKERLCPIRVLPEDRQPGEEFKPMTHEELPNVMEKRYYCSNFGRIWDTAKQQYLPWHYNEKYKEDGTNDGYCVTKMAYYADESTIKPKDVYVHRAIASTFLEKDETRPAVNHIDGDHTNNNVYNLEYINNTENMRHAVQTGLVKTGPENTCATIKDEQTILNIIEDLKDGVSMQNISKKYNVSKGAVFGIKSKKSYKKYTEGIEFPTKESKRAQISDKIIAICEELEIRDKTNKTYKQIADEIGVSAEVVKDINQGLNYKNISCNYTFIGRHGKY